MFFTHYFISPLSASSTSFLFLLCSKTSISQILIPDWSTNWFFLRHHISMISVYNIHAKIFEIRKLNCIDLFVVTAILLFYRAKWYSWAKYDIKVTSIVSITLFNYLPTKLWQSLSICPVREQYHIDRVYSMFS